MNKLYFNKSLFREEFIKTAILDYKSLANISLLNENQYYVCIFDRCNYDIELTTHEFENYVIGLTAKGL